MKLINFLHIFLAILLVTACQKTPKEQYEEPDQQPEETQPVDFDLDQIIVRGKIRVIIENNSTGYFIYRGHTMGYEYELLSLFAKYIGVDFEMVVIKNLEEALDKLNSGEGDIIAFPLTITKERKKKVLFTEYQYTVRQVLVQRKPDDWRNLKLHQIEKALIRDQVDLIGKNVHVRYRSSYLKRMVNLSDEIGGDIVIIEEDAEVETEELIKKVVEGQIDLTVSDEDIALVNATYYNDLDVATPVSFPTRIAWAIRLNAPNLRDTINIWQRKLKREPTFNAIYNKYFRSPKATLTRVKSEFFSTQGGKISEYDDLIKMNAKRLNWDWRLLAAQIYQESKFNPAIKSWAGAIGLMQVIPATGKQYGATDLYDPEQNIKGGTSFLIHLEEFWQERLQDPQEKLKFVLASYNVGLGHVIDARALTEKYGKDPDVWDGNVEYYLSMKSKPEFYKDPVSKSGYARGEEPVKYVKSILSIYQDYMVNFAADNNTP